MFGTIFSIFAFTALLMSAVGLYAVISAATTRRTQEIGVRIALGARWGDIQRLVMRRGLIQLGLGLAIGLTGRWVQRLSPNRIRRVVPITIALLGTLLILRGLPLGIPYLSPGATANGDVHCPACAH